MTTEWKRLALMESNIVCCVCLRFPSPPESKDTWLLKTESQRAICTECALEIYNYIRYGK